MSRTRPASLCGLFVLILFGVPALSSPPKNVIIFIGDGMGFEHVKAAGMYANGTAGTLCFEKFAHKAHANGGVSRDACRLHGG